MTEPWTRRGTDSFLGQIKIARGGRSLTSQENFIALKLMTVQPEADQPKAETGADLRSDTN